MSTVRFDAEHVLAASGASSLDKIAAAASKILKIKLLSRRGLKLSIALTEAYVEGIRDGAGEVQRQLVQEGIDVTCDLSEFGPSVAELS